MNIWEYLLAGLPLLAVSLALLRQMNIERQERKDMMEKYGQLALRVRGQQLLWEHPAQNKETPDIMWAGQPDMEFSGSTVTDLEGDDRVMRS